MAERIILPSGSTRIRWRNRGERIKQGITLPAGTPKREIARLVREIETAVGTSGRYVPPSVSAETLPALLDAYCDARALGSAAKRPARPRTVDMYRTVLGQLVAHLKGGKRSDPSVSTLSRAGVRLWLDSLVQAGKSQSTVKTYASTVKAFWRWGHERYPDDVPSPDMPDVRAPRPRQVVAPTWPQLDAALAQLTDRAGNVRRAMLIARWTGLRIGQASGVTWHDLDENWEGLGPALNIGPRLAKTEAEANLDRWIPIATDLWRLLRRWRLTDKPDGEQPIVGQFFPRDPHETMNGAFERAKIPERYWRGHSTHVARRRVNTHLAVRLADIPRRYFMGRSEPTVEGSHYIDPRELFSVIRAAVDTIPPLPAELDAAAT